MKECPLKPTLRCRATAELILEGRCYGCPFALQTIINNPFDAFGSKFGYRIEDIADLFAFVDPGRATT